MTTAHRTTIYRSPGKNSSFIDNINDSIDYYYKKTNILKKKFKFKNLYKKKSIIKYKLKIKLLAYTF
ncbi:hypothetical protein M951_chr1135 (nucleomorph) [Lotharella oceanica]|uniref:Uncharacterized protein n=1 Tax=Lotharella oceanica TaxID=641309 RepID=A0A060DAS6_9EUKA|nr:hypothetical protein M951_chr1135 [Lotharella oceanica]